MLAMRAQMSGNVPPVVQSSFINALNDYTTLPTVSSMPDGGSITRAGNAMLYDSTGKLTWAPNNVILYNNNFSDASWGKVQGSITSTTIVAPDGASTATEFTGSSTDGVVRQAVTQSTIATYIVSVWLKVPSGTKVTYLGMTDGSLNNVGNTTITITSSWQRFSFKFTRVASGVGMYIGGYSTIASGDVIHLWGAQIEAVTYQTTPSGTYYLNYPTPNTTAAYYGPRFDYDPATLAARGLLVEGARTNAITYSEAFNTSSAWSLTGLRSFGSGSVVDATASPSGVVNADQITEDLSTGYHGVYQAPAVTSGNAYTFSVFVKPAGRNYVCIRTNIKDGATFQDSFFNITSVSNYGTLVIGSQYTGAIQSVGDGWFRVSLSFVANGTYSASIVVCTSANGTSGSFTGDNTSGLYLFGAQLEAASFASSYIPTVASSVARAAETFAITGYVGKLVESFYIDEETGGSWSANINASATSPLTISTPTFGWVTSLRPYTNAYAGDISTPSWIDNTGTVGGRMYYDSTGFLTWAPENLLLNSATLSTQTVAVTSAPVTTGGQVGAVYVLSFSGTGSVAISGTSLVFYTGSSTLAGTGVSNRVSACFFAAQGSLTFTVTGTVTSAQLERVTYQTSPRAYIPTTSAAVYQPRYDYDPQSVLQGTGTVSSNTIVFPATFNDGSTCSAVNSYYNGQYVTIGGSNFTITGYVGSTRTATLNLTPAATGSQAFILGNPTWLTPRGMLIEEQRSNIVFGSNSFSNATYWASVSASLITRTDGQPSPDGANSACLIADNDTTSTNYGLNLATAVNVSASTTYTASVYLKYRNYQYVQINFAANSSANHIQYFDILNGVTAGTPTGITSSSITSVGNGWYRCIITFPTNAGDTTGNLNILPTTTTTTSAHTGVVGNGTFFFGAQVEHAGTIASPTSATFPTSYIPTTTGSVTRVADVVKLSGSALTTAQANKGSVIAQTTKLYDGSSNHNVLASSATTYRYLIYNGGANTTAVAYNGSSALTATIGSSGTWTAGPVRASIGWDTVGATIVANNGTATNTAGYSIPATTDAIYVGAREPNGQVLGGWIASFAAYNQRLPDPILKQKSTVGAPY